MSEALQAAQLEANEQTPIDVIFLDVDGHIANTIPALRRNHLELYRFLHRVDDVPEEFAAKAEAHLGGPADEIFRALYPEFFTEDVPEEYQGLIEDRLTSEFRRLAKEDPNPAEMIPGVPEMLQQLRAEGKQLILVTNRGWDTVEKALNAAGIDLNWFTYAYAAEDVNQFEDRKAGAIRDAHRQLGIDKNKMSMSGDDEKDVRAGLGAGVQAFYVPRPGLPDEIAEAQMAAAESLGRPGAEVRAYRTIRHLGRAAWNLAA